MPGFSGFITQGWSQQDAHRLGQMRASLSRENFDGEGTFILPEMGLGVAWSLHPRSSAALIPYWNADRTKCLIFYGEEYSCRDNPGTNVTTDDLHRHALAHIM